MSFLLRSELREVSELRPLEHAVVWVIKVCFELCHLLPTLCLQFFSEDHPQGHIGQGLAASLRGALLTRGLLRWQVTVADWERFYLDSQEVIGQTKLWTCPIGCCILGFIWGHSSQLDHLTESTGKLGTKGTDSRVLPPAASQGMGLGIGISARSPRWLMCRELNTPSLGD